MDEKGETNVVETYTYTARNADDPDQVLTLSLENNHLHFYLTGVLRKVEQVSQADDKLDEAKQQLKSQVKPGLLKVAEGLSGPFHINDVAAHFNGEQFQLNAWQRLAGLRLAPLWINMGRVDNSDAAEAFVSELEERQASASHPGRFFGPLDYWLGWAAVFFVLVVLFRWPRRARQSDQTG